jgi:tetratricopeptide (TPR) repeat protein
MSKITYDDLQKQHGLLRSDPQRFVTLCNQYIEQNPSDPGGYINRYYGFDRLRQKDLALRDLNMALSLDPHPLTHMDRGIHLLTMGEYQKAIDDFDRAESLTPDDFVLLWGPFYRAACHARLGNEEATRADCARIRDNHWMPGIFNTPKGNKQEVTVELTRLAAAARQARGS